MNQFMVYFNLENWKSELNVLVQRISISISFSLLLCWCSEFALVELKFTVSALGLVELMFTVSALALVQLIFWLAVCTTGWQRVSGSSSPDCSWSSELL